MGSVKRIYPSLFLLWLASLCWSQPVTPALPRSVPPSAQPPVTGIVRAVHDTGDPAANGAALQSAYNSARCGDQLALEPVTYASASGFVFNKKCTSASWMSTVSASLTSIRIPTYATQAQANNQNNAPTPPDATKFPKLISGTGQSVFACVDSTNAPAAYNYFGGLEITNTVGVNALVGCTNFLIENKYTQLPDHIIFDRLYVHGGPSSATVQMTRGIETTGSNITIINSYISDIYSGSADSQGIHIAYGPGPYLIQNNFITGSAENILTGGTGGAIGDTCTVLAIPAPTTKTATVTGCTNNSGLSSLPPGTGVMFVTSMTAPTYLPDDYTVITANDNGALTFTAIPEVPVPGAAHALFGLTIADVTVTGNLVYKPRSWNPASTNYDGIPRAVKALLEFKNCLRCVVNGNIMQHTWNGGQQTAVNLNSNDQNGTTYPWMVTQDITFTNNIVQDITGLMSLIPAQSYGGNAPGPMARVLVRNNLFWPVAGPGAGALFTVAGYIVNGGGYPAGRGAVNGSDSVQFIHNHLLGSDQNWHVGGSIGAGIPENYTNFVFKDNLTEFDQYRWANQCITYPDGATCVKSTVSQSFTIANNAVINTGAVHGDQGVSDDLIRARYGSLVLPAIVDYYDRAGFVNFGAINSDYHNFALLPSSPFAWSASDGTNPGVNFAQLDAAFGPPQTPMPGPLTCSGSASQVVGWDGMRMLCLGLGPGLSIVNGQLVILLGRP